MLESRTSWFVSGSIQYISYISSYQQVLKTLNYFIPQMDTVNPDVACDSLPSGHSSVSTSVRRCLYLTTSHRSRLSQEQVKSSHSFDLITSAWYSEETPTTYSCSARLWWPSKWSGHMCGSALYEFLTVTEPGGGGFSRENRWAGKEGGSHQAERACWASPYGRMNYRRLAMLTVRRRHIISDWSFLYMTGVT